MKDHGLPLRAALLISAALIAGGAAAQDKRSIAPGFPSKPVRILITVLPGASLDLVTRAISARISERMIHSVIVDNVTGANGAIAVHQTMSATPDGHMLLSMDASIALDAALGKFKRDIRTGLLPVAEMSYQPYLLYVAANSADRSLQDLIGRARRNPGKLNYGSTGVGSVTHLGMALICAAAGIEMMHIPYRGSMGSASDLASGLLDVLITTPSTALQLTKSGKIRPIALASRRLDAYRSIPTVADSGFPGYELANIYTLYAPSGTPAPTLAGLNREVAQALADAKVIKALAAELSMPAAPRSPQALHKALLEDLDRWAAVVRQTKR